MHTEIEKLNNQWALLWRQHPLACGETMQRTGDLPFISERVLLRSLIATAQQLINRN